MIISCTDNFLQNDFVNSREKSVIVKDMPDNEFLETIVKYKEKYNYIFVPMNKIELLKENNIRFFIATRKNKFSEYKNLIRLTDTETIFDKLP